MQRRWRGFEWRMVGRDKQGLAAVEFAAVAPIFLMTLIGVMEVGLCLFVAVTMEAGLSAAARYGITGCAPPAGTTRLEEAQAIITRHSLGLVDWDVASLTVTAYGSVAELGEPTAGVVRPDDLGAALDVVTYELAYDWPLFTGRYVAALSDDGLVPLRGMVAVRNEEWTGGGTVSADACLGGA